MSSQKHLKDFLKVVWKEIEMPKWSALYWTVQLKQFYKPYLVFTRKH